MTLPVVIRVHCIKPLVVLSYTRLSGFFNSSSEAKKSGHKHGCNSNCSATQINTTTYYQHHETLETLWNI
jgi:hypothetical protein